MSLTIGTYASPESVSLTPTPTVSLSAGVYDVRFSSSPTSLLEAETGVNGVVTCNGAADCAISGVFVVVFDVFGVFVVASAELGATPGVDASISGVGVSTIGASSPSSPPGVDNVVRDDESTSIPDVDGNVVGVERCPC